MKAIFWILIFFCMFCASVVITGISSYQYSSRTGWEIGEASALSRIINLVFLIVFGYFAYGIKRRKIFAWWMGAAFLGLFVLGFLLNITNAIGEKNLGFVVWIIISQILSSLIPVLVYVKWWKPKKETYFKIEHKSELGSAINSDTPLRGESS